ncbi:MAG: hypothetical protein ACLS6R_02720 [Eggerthella lenta]
MARGALRELGSDVSVAVTASPPTGAERQAGGHGVDRLRHGQKDPCSMPSFRRRPRGLRLQTVLIAHDGRRSRASTAPRFGESARALCDEVRQRYGRREDSNETFRVIAAVAYRYAVFAHRGTGFENHLLTCAFVRIMMKQAICSPGPDKERS